MDLALLHLRLPLLAVAFLAGILLAPHTGPFAAAPAVWAAAAVLVGTLSWRRWRLLVARAAAILVLLGGARAALEGAAHRFDTRVSGADDRRVDDLRGTVRGAVEDAPGVRRFVVAAEKPAGVKVLVSVWGEPPPDILPGDRVHAIGRMRAPRGYRVPGATDQKRITAARGADYCMAVDSSNIAISERGHEYSLWRMPTRSQRRLSHAIAARRGDRRGNAVVRAMVAGDRGGLDEELTSTFRGAGVSHVLAVSGLHLAAVALLVFVLLRRLWASVPALAMRVRPALAAAVVAAPVGIAYTLMTGARVSTQRALLVVMVLLFAAATSRRARVIDALGLAALVLLALDPGVAYEPSFQLSFSAAATLALALGGRRKSGADAPKQREMGRLRRAAGAIRRQAVSLLVASVWAAAATAPFSALSFGQVATGGPMANLLVVPAAELVILPFGLMGAAIGSFWRQGGGALIDVAVWVAGWVVAAADAIGSIAPVLHVFAPNPTELGAFALLWVAAVAGARGIWRRRRLAIAAGTATLVIAGSFVTTTRILPRLRSQLRVTFLDVGQGDAAVVELPGGGVWLIDSGGAPFVAIPAGAGQSLTAEQRARKRARSEEAPGALSVARFLAARRIRRIDLAIISHPHPDHFFGLRAVAREVEISELMVVRSHALRPPDPAYRSLLIMMALRGTRVFRPRLGTVVRRGDVSLTVLGPRYLDEVAAVDPVMNENENSLVVRLDFAGRRFLFSGDVESEAEGLLVARHGGKGLHADIVKVPHHGSATSSSPAWVEATSPVYAVISCGVANRFGVPAAAVVERWQRAGAEVLRTDRDGAITATVSAEGQLSVRTFD